MESEKCFLVEENIFQVDGEPGDVDEDLVLNENSTNFVLERCKDALADLLRDKCDRFEILALATKFEVDLEDEPSFSRQKYLLQKCILDNIIKDDKSDYYVQLLKETEQLCKFKRPSGYSCCLVGCMYQADRHRSYVKHIRDVHSNYHNFVCKFRHKCNREFSSISLLFEHIRQSHSTANTGENTTRLPYVNLACKCDMVSCGGKKFANLQLLLTHTNTVHLMEPRACIFENCSTQFNANSASRHHFRLKHLKTKKIQLKKKNLTAEGSADRLSGDVNVDQVSEENTESEDELETYGNDDMAFIEAVEVDQNVPRDDQSDYFLKAYADFLNRMCHYKFVPYKTMQTIASEFLAQSLKSTEERKVKLRESLGKLPNVSEEQIETIVREVLTEDRMLSAQKELDTDHKRNKFIRDNFKYTSPHEIVLNQDEIKRGAAKDVFHYVPITETFKHLVEDETFTDVLEKVREEGKTQTDVIKDIKDGAVYKQIEFFKRNPTAFVGIFYSDALEIVNPLGAARGKHKVVQIFWTLADIPRTQRSKIDRLQLAMILKEKLIKKYGYSVIYKIMMNDLKKLEEGVLVQNPVPRIVKCGVLVHSGDNLELHTLGGYSTCFSSKDICRFCHIQHGDLRSHIHDFDGEDTHKYWNVDEYDRICDKIEENAETTPESLDSVPITDLEEHLFDECEEPSDGEDVDTSTDDTDEDDDDTTDSNETYGLRERCPFNELQSFHAVYGFPPDLLHDVFEGVISQDLCGIIKILAHKSWFTIKEYNQALQNHRFQSYEMNDRPQQIANPKAMKLPGKAVSIWLHMRSFGMIIENFVIDYDDEVLSLGLELVDITERLCAVEFREYEIGILEEMIIKYLDQRKPILDDYPNLLGTPKPKHHYLTHYAEAIRKFGPPLSYWTGRFEAKHRVAKSTAESAKNFKNISATLSIRQQMRMASVFYGGIFDTYSVHLPDKVTMKIDLPEGTEFYDKLSEFMAPGDLICSEVILNSQQYRNGDIIITEVLDRNALKVGVVQAILVKSDKLFFVIRKYEAFRNKLNYYVTESADQTSSFFNPCNMIDYKPLVKYGTDTKFKFYLHHYISFSQD